MNRFSFEHSFGKAFCSLHLLHGDKAEVGREETKTERKRKTKMKPIKKEKKETQIRRLQPCFDCWPPVVVGKSAATCRGASCCCCCARFFFVFLYCQNRGKRRRRKIQKHTPKNEKKNKQKTYIRDFCRGS